MPFDGGNGVSRRLVLGDDGVGYSVHGTVIRGGTETHIHDRHDWEAVDCIDGRGEIETAADGQIHALVKGTIDVLDAHDEDYLRAFEGADLHMVWVFRPALTGNEVHDADGVYAPPE